MNFNLIFSFRTPLVLLLAASCWAILGVTNATQNFFSDKKGKFPDFVPQSKLFNARYLLFGFL